MKYAIINQVETPAPEIAVAYKYADPTEGARWIYTEDETRAIAALDPGLICEVYDGDDDDERSETEAAAFVKRFANTTELMEALGREDLEVDQFWEDEATSWRFNDGSRILITGSFVETY